MSFRQFGGLQFASKHNAVASYYNTTSNLLVTQNVGQPNSYITFLSDISGNITIYGNLDVSGNIHVSGDIDISGNLYVQENIDVSGNIHVGGDVDISGNLYVQENIDVSGNIHVGGDVDISGNLYVQENIDVSGNIHVGGDVDISGNLYVQENIDCSGNLHIGGDVDISGNLYIQENLDVSGNLHIGGDVDISGNLYIQENLDVSGNLHVGGNIDCSGNGSFDNSIFIYDLSSNVLYNSVIYQDNSAFNIQNNNAGGYIYINPNGSTGITVNNFGQVGIGTGSPQYTLDVSGDVNATSFNSSSDYRIKENVTQLDGKFVVDNLNPVTYLNNKLGKQDIGLIAHELQEIYPELVNGEKDGENLQSVNYIGLIPVLIKEVQELKKEIKLVKTELNEIKNK
jgi:cytoskeletal protein CcmA (bactofilin family)